MVLANDDNSLILIQDTIRRVADNVLEYRNYKESEEVRMCHGVYKPPTVVIMLDNSNTETATALKEQLINQFEKDQIESTKVNFCILTRTYYVYIRLGFEWPLTVINRWSLF